MEETEFITPEELEEFKRLVLQDKGITLSDEEAVEQASRLVRITEEYIKFKRNDYDIERYD